MLHAYYREEKMSHLGYDLEHEIESVFLKLEGKTCQDPLFDASGKICRTFRVPTSGMMASMPGDVLTASPRFKQEFMFECKARHQKTKKDGPIFRLNRAWITKNDQEAVKANYLPVFVLSFKRMKINKLWAIINEPIFALYLEKTKKPLYNIVKGGNRVKLSYRSLCKTADVGTINQHYILPFELFFESITK
jgi:hypothetical protein